MPDAVTGESPLDEDIVRASFLVRPDRRPPCRRSRAVLACSWGRDDACLTHELSARRRRLSYENPGNPSFGHLPSPVRELAVLPESDERATTSCGDREGARRVEVPERERESGSHQIDGLWDTYASCSPWTTPRHAGEAPRAPESDEEPLRPADGGEPIRVFILDDFAYELSVDTTTRVAVQIAS